MTLARVLLGGAMLAGAVCLLALALAADDGAPAAPAPVATHGKHLEKHAKDSSDEPSHHHGKDPKEESAKGDDHLMGLRFLPLSQLFGQGDVFDPSPSPPPTPPPIEPPAPWDPIPLPDETTPAPAPLPSDQPSPTPSPDQAPSPDPPPSASPSPNPSPDLPASPHGATKVPNPAPAVALSGLLGSAVRQVAFVGGVALLVAFGALLVRRR